LERFIVKVSKNRKYIIPVEHQEKYGFKPGKKIVFEENGKNSVKGHVV